MQEHSQTQSICEYFNISNYNVFYFLIIFKSHEMSELHYAIIGNNANIINEIIKAGADIQYKLKNGHTIEEFAKHIGNEDFVCCNRETGMLQIILFVFCTN